MARIIHVSKKGNDRNTGDKDSPFYSITKAANTEKDKRIKRKYRNE